MGYRLTVVNAISSIDPLRTLGSTWGDGGGYFLLLPTTFNAPYKTRISHKNYLSVSEFSNCPVSYKSYQYTSLDRLFVTVGVSSPKRTIRPWYFVCSQVYHQRSDCLYRCFFSFFLHSFVLLCLFSSWSVVLICFSTAIFIQRIKCCSDRPFKSSVF